MSANLEQQLIQKIHALPLQKQERVLEFVETLEVEAQVSNENESDAKEELNAEEKRKARMSLVGIGESKTGDISERVDEILTEGINKREGWSFP